MRHSKLNTSWEREDPEFVLEYNLDPSLHPLTGHNVLELEWLSSGSNLFTSLIYIFVSLITIRINVKFYRWSWALGQVAHLLLDLRNS